MKAEPVVSQPHRRHFPLASSLAFISSAPRKFQVEELLESLPAMKSEPPAPPPEKKAARNVHPWGWAIAGGLLLGTSVLTMTISNTGPAAEITELPPQAPLLDRAHYRWVGYHRMSPLLIHSGK